MANKTEIRIGSAEVLISYATPVACILNGEAYRTAKKWSRTTSKHIQQFLGGGRTAKEMPQEWFDDLLTVNTPKKAA